MLLRRGRSPVWVECRLRHDNEMRPRVAHRQHRQHSNYAPDQHTVSARKQGCSTHSQCQHAVSAGRQICQQCVNAKSTVLAPLASQYTGISCSSQNTGIDAGPRHFRNGTTMHHSQADKSVPSNRTKHRSHGSNGIDIDHGTHSAAGTEYAIFCGVELQILTLCFR